MLLKATAAALLLLAIVSATAHKNRVLVLVDNTKIKQTHSIFLKSLEERGYQVTIKRAEDQNLELIKYGEHLYDQLVLFAPSVQGLFLLFPVHILILYFRIWWLIKCC